MSRFVAVDHESRVRHRIAAHLDLPAEVIAPERELDRDLGLDAFDLALVALKLEGELSLDFPLALLDSIRTVGDFAKLVEHLDRVARHLPKAG